MSAREPPAREGGPMAWVAGVAALVALGGLQMSPLANWGLVRVDGLLDLTVAWAALSGPRRGLIFGMLAGAIEDTLIGGGIAFTVLKGLLGLLTGTVRPILNVRQVLISIPLVAFATVVQEGVLSLLHRDVAHFAVIWLPAALSNALIALPMYLLARAIWRPGKGSVAPRRRRTSVAK